MAQISITENTFKAMTDLARKNDKKGTFITQKYGSEDMSGLSAEKIQATVMGLLQGRAARIRQEVPDCRQADCTRRHNKSLLCLSQCAEVFVTAYIISSMWNGKGRIYVQEEFWLSAESYFGRVFCAGTVTV